MSPACSGLLLANEEAHVRRRVGAEVGIDEQKMGVGLLGVTDEQLDIASLAGDAVRAAQDAVGHPEGTRLPSAQGVVGPGLVGQDQLASDGLAKAGCSELEGARQRRDGFALVASRNTDHQSLHDTSHLVDGRTESNAPPSAPPRHHSPSGGPGAST